jgi:hypothetical protein
MVVHWKRHPGPHAGGSMVVNAVGAVVTGLTTLVIAVAKFSEGAWITLAIIPALLLLMGAIRRHYHAVTTEISSPSPVALSDLKRPIVVVPIEEWNRVSKKALRFALTLSDDVQALHIDAGVEGAILSKAWAELVEEPARQGGRIPPQLVTIKSPYRVVVGPILSYIRQLEESNPDRQIAIVLSELVERRWYQYLLHNQRAQVLTALLTMDGDERIVVINVPWYMKL